MESLNHFEKVVQNKELPDELIESSTKEILTLIIELNNCSKSAARRLIQQSAIQVNGIRIKDEKLVLIPGDIIRAGKRSFAKII